VFGSRLFYKEIGSAGDRNEVFWGAAAPTT
jgi:hypothetical protein